MSSLKPSVAVHLKRWDICGFSCKVGRSEGAQTVIHVRTVSKEYNGRLLLQQCEHLFTVVQRRGFGVDLPAPRACFQHEA